MADDYKDYTRYESQALKEAQKFYSERQEEAAQTGKYDPSLWAGKLPSGPYEAYSKPTWLGGVSSAVNPLTGRPFWADPVQYNSDVASSVAAKPFDAAAWVTQRVVSPVATLGLATKFFSQTGNNMTQNFIGGMYRGLTGTAMPATGLASSMAKGVGWMGGMAAPFMMGTLAADAIDDLAIQPYLRVRAGTQDLRADFRHQVFGDSTGGLVGQGLSRLEASKMASGIDKSSRYSNVYSSAEHFAIGSAAAQMGLMDDVTSAQIPKRVMQIARQVEVFQQISQDPNWRNALETLAKLKQMGANPAGGLASQAMSTYSSIASDARAAGISVQRMFSEVAGQGAMMYQSMGMNPFMGAGVASNIYAGFSSAARSGVMTPATLARMGGIGQATSTAMGAQLRGASSNFGMTTAYNRYMLGINDTDIVRGVSAFGGHAAKNPLATMGDMALFGNQLKSQLMSEDGATFIEEFAIKRLKMSGQRPAGANGYSASQIAGVMRNEGYSDEEIQAYIQLRMSQTDPASVRQRERSVRAEYATRQRQSFDTENTGMEFTKRFSHTLHHTSADIGNFLMAPARGAARNVAKFSDSMERGLDRFFNGKTLPDNPDYILDEDALLSATGESRYTRGRYKKSEFSSASSARSTLELLQKYSSDGSEIGELARRILQSNMTGPESKADLRKFIRAVDSTEKSRGLDTDMMSGVLYGDLSGNVSKYIKSTPRSERALMDMNKIGSAETTGLRGNVGNNYSKARVEGTSSFDKLRLSGLAAEFVLKFGGDDMSQGEFEDLLQSEKYASLMQAVGKGSFEEKSKVISSLARQGASFGLGVESSIAADLPSAEAVLSGKIPVESLTKDPSLRNKLRTAIGNNDKAAVSKLLLEVVKEKNFGKLGGQAVNLGNHATLQELANSMQSQISAAKEAQKGSRESMSEEGDYSEARSVFTSLDGAAKELKDAGGALQKAAEMLSGGKIQPKSTPSSSSMWDVAKSTYKAAEQLLEKVGN